MRIPDPYELGQEFYRWEFATAVAGSILEINPFDQPNVQEAKDRTNDVLSGHGSVPGTGTRPLATVEELLGGAEPPEYVCIQAFIDPARERELEPLVGRARESGCVVTHGLGPRYLHSTGQLPREPLPRIGEPDGAEGLSGPLAALGAVEPAPPQRELDVRA